MRVLFIQRHRWWSQDWLFWVEMFFLLNFSDFRNLSAKRLSCLSGYIPGIFQLGTPDIANDKCEWKFLQVFPLLESKRVHIPKKVIEVTSWLSADSFAVSWSSVGCDLFVGVGWGWDSLGMEYPSLGGTLMEGSQRHLALEWIKNTKVLLKLKSPAANSNPHFRTDRFDEWTNHPVSFSLRNRFFLR